ncbi:MAG: HlyD family efflux transporter periplasmic adaptor subunit [Mesorhizobium sp.]|nr:MAG: HlyD family efflux transporter periplasmic adaptor subunit [Mesorhizobium sp.]RWJ11969.1 MAG: HlyD family efflux transporter periplasmic adaptor subunit [Mesorhizobium sp.]
MQALPMRVLGVIGVAIVVAAAIFVSTATYSRMESVSGWVVPEGGLIRVTARQGGVIESVAASEGDVVAVGQSLANLRLSSNLETGDAGTALVGQLEAEIAAAQAQALATREKLAAEEELVRAQRAALSLELEENRRRLSSIDDRATLLKANVDRAKQLSERGFVSRKGLEEAQLVELTAQQDISQMRATILSYERQVGDLDARLRALPLDVAAADAQARVTQAALAQKRTEAAVRQNYVVGATVKGRVVAVPITKGQDVQAGGVVAVLTPADSSLEAELFIPSRAAGFIRQGQDVRLMYHAFPYQKFGSAHGTVSLVSRTVLGPNEINIPGVEVQEPVFRVKVELERESIDAYGQEIPIQPGMLLSADVIIDRRTLLEWLLDPIYAAGRMG